MAAKLACGLALGFLVAGTHASRSEQADHEGFVLEVDKEEDGWPTREECCCSKTEPLLHFMCIEDSMINAPSGTVYSSIFKSDTPLDEITALESQKKRALVPEEREFWFKDRAAANLRAMTPTRIQGLEHTRKVSKKCKQGVDLKKVEGPLIDLSGQLLDLVNETTKTTAFYRFAVEQARLEWSMDTDDGQLVAVDGAVYRKVEDPKQIQCIAEEDSADITFSSGVVGFFGGVTCKDVVTCQRVMNAGACGPEGWTRYQLYGRDDGKCETVKRGFSCPDGGYENSWNKLYGDTWGMYKMCKCSGSKTCPAKVG